MNDNNDIYYNWISVNDRLPEKKKNGKSDTVLVTNKKIISIGYYYWQAYDGYEVLDWITLGHCKPTHWMPLPEMPK